jgi:hypothetical protein
MQNYILALETEPNAEAMNCEQNGFQNSICVILIVNQRKRAIQ